MRTRSKVLVTLLAGLVGLVGIELAVRALHVSTIPAPGDVGTIGRASADPDLKSELVPGAKLTTQFFNRQREVVREVPVAVNDQGFRGPTVLIPKPAGTFRIVCLGDSQTFGNSVGEGESWPAVLDAALHGLGDRHVEVMNCGVGGYETEQEVAYLEKRLLAYKPDLVILGFFMNDTALPGVQIESPSGFSASLIRTLAPGRPGFLRGLRRTSQLVNLGADWMFRKLTLARWVDQRVALYSDDFEGWKRARAAIRHARQVSNEHGACFMVLLVPLLMRDSGELMSELPYRTVSAFCTSEDIPFYDPAPLFAGLDVDTMRVHPRDLHSNATGHRTVGEGLAHWMEAQGVLKKHCTR